jgi:Flp pilus assembly protein TadG
MFKALRNEKGSAMIIYVCMFVVLLGMAAVAVDTGTVAIEKQRLQKAVDAAALAAAQALPDASAARSAANRYVTLNGFSPSDISVTFENNNKTIVIKATKRVDYTFARVLGISSTDVALGAKAMCAQLGGAFNYAVFSGSQTSSLTLNGSGYTIKGSLHSNYNFIANGSGNTITGACEAAGTITVNGSGNNIDHRTQGAAIIGMPDLSETIRQQAEAAGQLYVGDKTFNGSSIDLSEPVYVEGNITINGSKFTGVGFLFATGNITFNGSSLKMSTGDSVCIYSKNGNIRLNGSGAVVDGILYAPGGGVTMNGSDQTVHGRIIANTVNVNGSGISITAAESDVTCLPSSYVKLID